MTRSASAREMPRMLSVWTAATRLTCLDIAPRHRPARYVA
jgi:hypothetical protein